MDDLNALYATTFLDDTEESEPEPGEYTADGEADGGMMFWLNAR